MMVGCQTGDVKLNLALLPRCRNMSGGSTGSLGSLESEIPELSPLGVSWSSDVISTSGMALSNVRTSPQSVASDSSSVDANSATSGQKNILNPTRYKTEMCRPFTETGYCKYGEKCQFAHGAHELRAMPRHPKYKTELCRTFHTTGFCPYGPRCHFIHNEDESKLGEINQMKQQYAQQQAVQEIASQAARFQALISQNAMDGHLKALMAQGHHSVIQNTAFVQTQVAIHGMVPQPLSPDQFQQWMSVPPPALVRSDTLGSTGETPPSSAASSPVTTPKFQWREPATEGIEAISDTCMLSAPVHSQPTAVSQTGQTSIEVSHLAQGFDSLSLQLPAITNTAETAILPQIFHDTPPSSPESGSLSSSGRSMRLPVFSRLAASSACA